MLTEFNPVSGRITSPVIHIENVSVQYRLPREKITSFKEYAIRRLKRTIEYTNFWALRNISLTVNRGEVVGVIGPNGAGKSTLLKVIARVLRPTDGRVRVRGRVAPLLELGTGFDFELTGIENIFLNSALLGYSQRDTEARVRRIVEFAGLGDFIQAPLRTYSTGMVARLGFAIATDVEPDVLLVDEILSVGDAEFKLKAEYRMDSFQKSGATILIVSHNPDTIRKLCQRALWLEHGKIQAEGTASQVIAEYDLALRQRH